MGLFSKKQVELSLSEKLASFKSTFVKAHDGAVELATEIAAEVQVIEDELKVIQEELEVTKKLQGENANFIANLKQFV